MWEQCRRLPLRAPPLKVRDKKEGPPRKARPWNLGQLLPASAGSASREEWNYCWRRNGLVASSFFAFFKCFVDFLAAMWFLLLCEMALSGRDYAYMQWQCQCKQPGPRAVSLFNSSAASMNDLGFASPMLNHSPSI